MIKKLKSFIIPIVVMMAIIPLTDRVITKKLDKLLEVKDMGELKTVYNDPLRDRGIIAKKKMLEDEDYVLLGSSELSSEVEQNPKYFNTESRSKYDISMYGRSYSQSLQHATLVGSNNDYKGNEKISLIVSLQWFEKEPGIAGSDFQVNFSEQQFYAFLNNEKISKEEKVKYTTRVAELLTKGGEYGEERIYSELYSRDNLLSNIALAILKPYYNFKEYLLNIKDKIGTYKYLVDKEDKKERAETTEIDWENEYRKADEQGQASVTNNDLYVDDNYYDTYIKPNYENIKGAWSNVDLLKSQELKDYELFLDISKESGIEPLIIIPPVNGKYYDHLGLTLEKREEFYKTVENMAKERGFEVFSLADKDYEKYYLKDVMHLGWKGWLEINEKIYNHFN